MTKLPAGWTSCTISDVATLSLGKMLDRKRATGLHKTPYLRNVNVRWGDFDLGEIATMDIRPEELHRVQAFPGDVIICEGGEPGRVAVWRGPEPIALQKALHRVRPAPGVNSYYLAYCIEWLSGTRRLDKSLTGTTIKHLPKERLAEVIVPLAPPAEQDRIIAALEEHLSRMEASAAALSRSLRLTATLRERVLDQMWLGGWGRTRLGDILAAPLANGRSVAGRPGGFPVLRLSAIRDRRIQLGERKGGAWTDVEAAPFLVRQDDFLLARGNGSLSRVGRGGLVDERPDPVAYPDTMIRVRVRPDRYDSRLLALVWDSGGVRRQIEGKARTTAGIYKINQRDLTEIVIPDPPRDRHEAIIERMVVDLESVGHIASQLDRAQIQQRALRASVLAAAFSGGLVPQDPADEPASVLLERIRAERTRVPSARRRRTAVP